MGRVDHRHPLVAQGAVLPGEAAQSVEVRDVGPQPGHRVGAVRGAGVEQDPGAQVARLVAVRAPAVAHGAFHVPAGAGERAQVGDAVGGAADGVRLAQPARRLQQGYEREVAVGQPVVALAPREHPVGGAYVVGVGDLGQHDAVEAGAGHGAQFVGGLPARRAVEGVDADEQPHARCRPVEGAGHGVERRRLAVVGDRVLQVEDRGVGARRLGLGQPVGSAAGDEEQGAQRDPGRWFR